MAEAKHLFMKGGDRVMVDKAQLKLGLWFGLGFGIAFTMVPKLLAWLKGVL